LQLFVEFINLVAWNPVEFFHTLIGGLQELRLLGAIAVHVICDI
jgi:hypothetical protein